MISTRMRPLKINKIENQTNKIPLNIKKKIYQKIKQWIQIIIKE